MNMQRFGWTQERTEQWEKSANLYPVANTIGTKPVITITPQGQMNFSRFFNVLLEKTKDNPNGTYNFLDFKLGVEDADDNPTHIIYVGFHSEKKDFLTLEMGSKYPKSVVGIKPVLWALSAEGLRSLPLLAGRKYVWEDEALEIDIEKKLCALRVIPEMIIRDIKRKV
jgi:hypothetical protein|tara:strand:+ start:66 stop:569 length:504 start_codon:yes stop_codon:yes gene_type:complete